LPASLRFCQPALEQLFRFLWSSCEEKHVSRVIDSNPHLDFSAGKGSAALQIQLSSNATYADFPVMLDDKGHLKRLALILLILASGAITTMYLAKRMLPGSSVSSPQTPKTDLTTEK
jgi:hypothetical protein